MMHCRKRPKKDSKAIRQESKERDKELKAMIRELEQTSLGSDFVENGDI